MKDRYLWIGIFIFICSLFGNYFYFQSKQLERPVFLDHYYETYIQEESPGTEQLTFYFLSNRANPVFVRDVSVEGIRLQPLNKSGIVMWSFQERAPYFEQVFTHYNLQTISVELPKDEIFAKLGTDNVWSFDEMQVTFSNGETINAKIGEVRIYEELVNNDVLDFIKESSNTSYFSETHYTVSKPLTIEAMTFPFADNVNENLYIKMNLGQKNTTVGVYKDLENIPDWYNKDNQKWWDERGGITLNGNIFPLRLEESDHIRFYNFFNPDGHIAYNFYMTILGITDDGETFEYKVPVNAIHSPHLTLQAVNEIISEKHGGQSK